MSATTRWGRLRGSLFNAMVFKELTQGVRSNGYLSLFGLLLGAGWLTVLLFWYFGTASENSNAIGGAAAVSLLALLELYALIVGARAHTLTVKEIENHTFELYLLAGMSPERLVRGKVVTCLYQFLFGFSTVVPFIFCSYFLRGLDFMALLVMLVMLLLGAVAWYYFSIFAAFVRMMTPLKTTITLAYFGALAFVGVIVVPILFFAGASSGEWLVEAWREFFAWDADLPGRLALFVLLYVLPLVVFATISCHVICPDSDSREDRIKALLLLAIAVYAGLAVFLGTPSEVRDAGWQVAIVSVALAAFGWIHRERMQVMPAITSLRGSLPRRVWLWLFGPGRAATARLLAMFYVACAAVPWLAQSLHGPSWPTGGGGYGGGGLPMREAAIPWLLPAAFFTHLYFWNAMARRVPGLEHELGRRRLAILLAWGIMAALVAAPNVHRTFNNPWWMDVPGASIFLAHFVSPIMTGTIAGFQEAVLEQPASLLIIGLLAAVGIALAVIESVTIDAIPERVRHAAADAAAAAAAAAARTPTATLETVRDVTPDPVEARPLALLAGDPEPASEAAPNAPPVA